MVGCQTGKVQLKLFIFLTVCECTIHANHTHFVLFIHLSGKFCCLCSLREFCSFSFITAIGSYSTKTAYLIFYVLLLLRALDNRSKMQGLGGENTKKLLTTLKVRLNCAKIVICCKFKINLRSQK